MKIAFIFNDSHTNSWTTPGGLSMSLKNLGHDISYYDLKNINEIIDISKNHQKYDAVCLWEAGTISLDVASIWNKDNFKYTLMIAESGDDPQILKYNLSHTMPADIVLTPDIDSCDFYKNSNKKSFWFTHWGDENVWKKSDQKETGMVSTSSGPRPGIWKDVMNSLTKNFSKNFINPRLNGGPYMTVEDNSILYSNSDVVVQVSSHGEITRRLFEASICERVVVTDRLNLTKKLDHCLVENEHILLYSSPEECVEKVRFLLDNHEKRKQMAKSAYNHVLKNHSASARANQLIKIINENK